MFTLCSSCTITYYFSDSYNQSTTPQQIYFRETVKPVDVFFETQNLVFKGRDGLNYSVSMDVGLIPSQFQTYEYFIQPNKGMIGLMPTIGGVLTQQFLYSFSQQYNLLESFAIIPYDGAFIIGSSSNQQIGQNMMSSFGTNATATSQIQINN